MPKPSDSILPTLLDRHHKRLLEDWFIQQQGTGAAVATGDDAETRAHSVRFLTELRKGLASGELDGIEGAGWSGMREVLDDISRAQALKGFSPSQTAGFVFSLREPLFGLLRREVGDETSRLAEEMLMVALLLDRLVLYTTEVFQKSREDVITRQQQELLELSTPVVRLWEGIVAVPLIGTLDSNRTQIVMENLLQQIVTTGAQIAIIDITGVPTVDTLVAQHLLKTVSAARLMGADCIISGIRPQIAQTIVHLGVELSVTSKASLAGAFELALRRLGKTVVDRAPAKPVAE